MEVVQLEIGNRKRKMNVYNCYKSKNVQGSLIQFNLFQFNIFLLQFPILNKHLI